jgi:hypothetical protein
MEEPAGPPPTMATVAWIDSVTMKRSPVFSQAYGHRLSECNLANREYSRMRDGNGESLRGGILPRIRNAPSKSDKAPVGVHYGRQATGFGVPNVPRGRHPP